MSETKVADDLVNRLIGIQEDLPNEDDRATLGFAAHELRKLRAQLAAVEAELSVQRDSQINAVNQMLAAEAQVEIARKALEPFAALAKLAALGHRDDRPICFAFNVDTLSTITVGHLREALRSLKPDGDGK